MTNSGEDHSRISVGSDPTGPATQQAYDGSDNPSDIAGALLEAIRRDENVEAYERQLAHLDYPDLRAVRTDQATGLAFWLNCYNAGAQLVLDREPDVYDTRWRFFRRTAITIGGVSLSLDDIEHGIMRGSKSKYGFGYLPRLARTGMDRHYRLDLDPRIHFALNCGAASCPAIRRYTADTVDETLEIATRQYLSDTVTVRPTDDIVVVPRLCFWYLGDFGGRSGIRSFLKGHDILPAGAKPTIQFDDYDWTKAARNFAEQ